MQRPQLMTDLAHPVAGHHGTRNDVPRRAVHEDRRRIRAANAALGWVAVFLGFHIYWYFGGSLMSPGKLPGRPHTLAGWAFNALVDGAFVLGLLVPVAISRGWARGRLARPVAILVWLGCAVLILRGAAGLIDDLTRVTGVLPNGLSGLSTKDATGTTSVTWAQWAIETYFLLGGVIFGALGLSRRQQRQPRHNAHRDDARIEMTPAVPSGHLARRSSSTEPQ